jgi:type IV secretory pathway VirB2 component (pilin)
MPNNHVVRSASIVIAACVLLVSTQAFASSIAGLPMTMASGPMPWETVLAKVASSLTGNTAKLMALLAICICGYGYMTSEGGGMRKLMGVGVGIALVVGAGNLVTLFFQGGSGAVI